MTEDYFAGLSRRTTEDGRERRFGLELEFAGLSVSEAADAVAEVVGGSVSAPSRFVRKVVDSRIGDVRVELDTDYLKNERYLSALTSIGINAEEDVRRVEDLLETLAQSLVPCEVVTAPVPLSKLAAVEEVREALRRRKAQGTYAHFTYAFGLHVNAEAASLDASYLRAMLVSFLLLYDWIVDDEGIDWTRRLTPFIDPFSAGYVRKVIDPDYRPDLEGLIADYLEANPTRNRALDMLPIFMQVRPRQVRAVVTDSAVQARPAFHYRLADCRIDESSWRLAAPLGRWALVEALAEDEPRRHALARDYLELDKATLFGRRAAWIERLKEELTNVRARA